MANNIIGVAIPAPDPQAALASIRRAEELGVKAAWMTSGGDVGDALTLFAAAAAQTETILLGTSIMRTWTRHPIVAARQAQTIAGIAPGRIRLGIGPSHRAGMTQTFGVDFREPLGHLREYIQILSGLSHDGKIDFDGRHYSAHFAMSAPTNVPVMASALRPASFEACGELADGAISWVCPLSYVRDVALPALKAGAQKANRPTPPLIVHAPVCVTDDLEAARNGVREQLGYFPKTPFYTRMFERAGFPESDHTGWTNDMLDSVLIAGNENQVSQQLNEIFAWGGSEVLASVITVGDAEASRERTMRLIAEVSAS